MNIAATLGDLFGDADDISSDEEKKDGEDKGEDSEVRKHMTSFHFNFIFRAAVV